MLYVNICSQYGVNPRKSYNINNYYTWIAIGSNGPNEHNIIVISEYAKYSFE